MNILVQHALDKTLIRLSGRFEYAVRRDFDAAVKRALDAAPARIEVNLSEVNYMDSSALGMLLVLRDKAAVHGKQITLAEAQGVVRRILDVANFDKLFATA